MNVRQVMDLLVAEARKNGGRHGREALVEQYPEIGDSLICEAIRKLDARGVATVQYGDNKPIFFILKG